MRGVLFLTFLTCFLGFSQRGEITITNNNLGSSQSKDVLYYEDKDHSLTVQDIIAMDASEFTTTNFEVPNFDFTTSKFWLKFTITNNSDAGYFILETARPITNKVNFYQLRGNFVENEFFSGDDYHYSEKIIQHRKNLFPISIEPGESKDYIIECESDGEVIILPVRIFDKFAFFAHDYRHQFSLGFYYGLMALVIVIYFFFFVMLKDKTFLYYIGYVAAQALLQFSLDGYSFHHFFPSGGYGANHFILFIAGITVISLLKYVTEFLHMKERFLRMHKVFIGLQILVVVGVLMSLIPGKTYVISYPVINGISLVSIILSVVAIYVLRFRKLEVDKYFTIAFTILIAGAIIFILGNFNIVGNAEMGQTALKISSALEVAILSISMSNKYRKLQKDKEEAQAIALVNLTEKNALMDDINAKLEVQVKERTFEIEKQKEQLAESNKEILDSIHYAKRIQEAILPSEAHIQNILPNSFTFYRPKDVVSGDFYFVERTISSTTDEELTVFAAVDCTGHGVPGAFMSIVGSNLLTQTLTEPKVNSPADVLNYLNQGVSESLRQNIPSNETTVRDGMDIAICALDLNKRDLYFAGAKNPLYIVRKEAELSKLGFAYSEEDRTTLKSESEDIYLNEIKGDAHPIGAYIDDELKPFTNHKVEVRKGDMIYIFSDGFPDQFGGGDGKKYKYKNFKKFLIEISQLPIKEQQKLIIAEFDDWKGNFEQLDDVLVIGVRID